MIYFTSDTHFGHANVIKYEHRPFGTAEEMNAQLIQNWNVRVRPEDDIYILGDFTLKGPSFANAFLKQLQGRKHLVRGNHDCFAGRQTFQQDLTVWVKDYFELTYQDQLFVLCHYPFLSWREAREGSFHLHGHLHSFREANEQTRRAGIRRFDVGVDANGMAPVSIEEILAFWAEP